MPSPIEAPLAAGSAGGNGGSKGNTSVSPHAFALALLVATSLQIMENLLPRIPLFPWMRIGISYVVILPFLLEYGAGAAFLLLLARNLTAILYGGQPFTTFLIGTGAGALALLGIGPLVRWAALRGWLGILGASVALATAFNLAQLALVKWILIRHAGFYFMIGPMLAWSLLSGALVAWLVLHSETDLARMFAFTHASGAPPEKPEKLSGSELPFLLGLAALMGLLFGDLYRIQVPALAVLLWLSRDRGKLLFAAWPFFFYLAWLHLFHTPGEYVFRDWVTREGLLRFGLNALRLANFILLGRWLSGKFPWRLARRSESPYLQGFLLSLPLLANMFESSLEFGREIGRRLWAGERKGILTPAFEAWRKKMSEPVESAEPAELTGTAGAADEPKAGNP
jgi:uncharacterized membrane protein